MDTSDKKKIRKLAEKIAKENPVNLPDTNPENYHALIQELNVHQIELELQNEELRSTQAHLEYNKNKFAQLFNSAPVSFIVYWHKIESYIGSHTEAEFTHSMCPECMDKTYGGEDWYTKMKNKNEQF